MPGATWNRTSQEWQELNVRLLSLKFGIGQFVAIPDTVRGDCGLEGFTRSGKGFQCYAAEGEPLTTAQLTKKQKAKITADVSKLTKYKDTLAGLLGPTVLREWIIVVPRWEDKSLLTHAEEKFKALRSVGTSFISPDIVPGFSTLDDFVVEYQTLVKAGAESLRVDSKLVDPASIDHWAAANDELVETLDRKALIIRHGDNVTAKQLRNEEVRHYLDGQNTLAKLRSDFPDLFEAVDRIKKDKEHFLVTESLTTAVLPPQHLEETRDALETEYKTTMRGIAQFTVRQLVHEAIADWLLRCPLDFPGSPHHGHPVSKP